MKTFLKIAIIVGSLVAILLTIPDLFVPIGTLIDGVFGTDMMIVMNNIYDTIPSDLMDLLAVCLSVLTISIFISWLNGGVKS